MNEKTRLAIGIAAGAALLGIAGNWLLWTDRWGAGFALWMALCVAAAIALPRLARHAPLGAEWALVAAAFFAGAFAWRATPWLRNLDVMVAAVALSVPFWRGATGKLREVLPAEAAVGAASAIGGRSPAGAMRSTERSRGSRSPRAACCAPAWAWGWGWRSRCRWC